ncbi:MAG: galactose mutarotase [Lachnospiraceae bacterium]|nr:galactose mutarotase [Lachnospiraceae bacterium]
MRHLTICNDNGAVAEILDFGGIIRRLLVPDRAGRPTNVVTGFADEREYTDNPCFMGALIGPACNRTARAAFTLDGITYRIPQNEGENNLHSDDAEGFHKKTWEVSALTKDSVTLRLHAPDGELGFPGNRDFTVSYSLTGDNALRMICDATTDKTTLCNPTQHTYFNLDGARGGEIHGHRARFFASSYLPVGEGMIVTGERRAVAGSPFDFLEEKEIGRDIDADDAQLLLAGGYDHCFMTDAYDGTLRRCAVVRSAETGIAMEVKTTLPGFQFYSGNFFDCPRDTEGRHRGIREAFCIETQYPPDAVHHPDLPQPVLRRDETYHAETIFRFYIDD